MKRRTGTLTTLLLSVALLHAEDSLRVVTEPPGVGVYVDGVAVGVTPLALAVSQTDLPVFRNAGKPYRVILYKDFYDGEILEVVYTPGSDVVVETTLSPVRQLRLYDGIFRDKPKLGAKDVFDLVPAKLWLLRAEVYAYHGKRLEEPDLRAYFSKTSWYRENPGYSEEMITDADTANLALIDAFLGKIASDAALHDAILQRVQFVHKASGAMLIFSDTSAVTWRRGNSGGGEFRSSAGYAPYYISSDRVLEWKVADGSVYISVRSQGLFKVMLDPRTGEFVSCTEEWDEMSSRFW